MFSYTASPLTSRPQLKGSNNDLNVLDRSPVFDEVLEGRAPEINYTINGNNYNMGYYLTDGIYPEWATFVKTIPRPQVQVEKQGKIKYLGKLLQRMCPLDMENFEDTEKEIENLRIVKIDIENLGFEN
ncbi:hypothetical protein AgCh_028996 [Apium graveolens]